MRPGGEGVSRANERIEPADPARAVARVSASWIRALANAWEDDWSRAQAQAASEPAPDTEAKAGR